MDDDPPRPVTTLCGRCCCLGCWTCCLWKDGCFCDVSFICFILFPFWNATATEPPPLLLPMVFEATKAKRMVRAHFGIIVFWKLCQISTCFGQRVETFFHTVTTTETLYSTMDSRMTCFVVLLFIGFMVVPRIDELQWTSSSGGMMMASDVAFHVGEEFGYPNIYLIWTL